MIDNFSIERFKGIKKLENVNLNKITLIGGKNNVGKSTVLEALFCYADIKNPHIFTRLMGWRGFTQLKFEPESMWAPFFNSFSLEQPFEIAVSMAGASRRLAIEYHEHYTPTVAMPLNNAGIFLPGGASSTDIKALTLTHKTKNVIDFCAHHLLTLNSMNYYVEQDHSDLLHLVYFITDNSRLLADDVELLGNLDKHDAQEKILPFLRVFEHNLKRFQVIKEGNQDIIYADLGNNHKIPVNSYGSGFCRCLSIALILAAGQKEALFIDEIENGIHYSFLNNFWSFLFEASKAYNCQIIATTHSHEMIESFCKTAQTTQQNDIGYIRLANEEKEGNKAYQFNFDELSAAQKFEMEVR